MPFSLLLDKKGNSCLLDPFWSSSESPGRRLLSHETLLWAKTDARVRVGGDGRGAGVGENSRFQQIWKLAQKLPPAGLLFTAANAQEYIWLYFVCCIWSYFLVGHIFCVVFGHIFFFESNFTFYIPLRHNQARYKEKGNQVVFKQKSATARSD